MSHAAVGVQGHLIFRQLRGKFPRWLWRLVRQTQRRSELGAERRCHSVAHWRSIQLAAEAGIKPQLTFAPELLTHRIHGNLGTAAHIRSTAIRFETKVFGLKSHALALHILNANLTTDCIMPNVKDEPRRELARCVPGSDQHFGVSVRSS
jgi:hypothetical protein